MRSWRAIGAEDALDGGRHVRQLKRIVQVVERRRQEPPGAIELAESPDAQQPGGDRRDPQLARDDVRLRVVAGDRLPDTRNRHASFGFADADVAHRAELAVPALEPRRRSPSPRPRSARAPARTSNIADAWSWFVWAPPTGSGTISSMTPNRSRSGAVSFSASRRFDLAIRVAPEDRGAPFRRNHAVDRELVHQDAIANRQAQRPAAATLAVDGDDDRRVERRHLAQVVGNRFRDAPLFRFHARVRRRRVDERRPPAA